MAQNDDDISLEDLFRQTRHTNLSQKDDEEVEEE